MNAADLLANLQARGFSLVVEGDKIIVSPASRLTDDLRATIRAHKPELLSLLAGQPGASSGPCPKCDGPTRLVEHIPAIFALILCDDGDSCRWCQAMSEGEYQAFAAERASSNLEPLNREASDPGKVP